MEHYSCTRSIEIQRPHHPTRAHSLRPSDQMSAEPKEVAFLGLGAMGTHLARHLQEYSQEQLGQPALVWNRTPEKAQSHARAHGTRAVGSLADLKCCAILCLCLPTTADVKQVLKEVPLQPNSLVIDCTSGDPEQTRELAAHLLSERGIRFVDAPVSGGPKGADAGTVTSMVGGDPADVAEASAVINAWSRKLVHCGPVGAGDATKSINNVLNAAHLCLATEGMLALKQYGVAPETALEAINGGSGMSLQTQRLPDNVISRKFSYGFALGLMKKDCTIAGNLIEQQTPSATLIPRVVELLKEAEEMVGPAADYTQVAQLLETRAGLTLG